ncbi:MAG: hypothetical protein ACK5QC_09495 [Bacteroidota bacterium]|jgi:hypothetical protein|nr:hypothetical protein [Bacteroidota bacterium]MCA6444092.1 hypothetical protein [Bacteroidota bacterium]
MKRKILKFVIGGVVLGTALFFAPFLTLKIVALFFIIGAVMRMLFWRRVFWYAKPMLQVAYTDRIRSMSEEEYEAYKIKMNQTHAQCYKRGFRSPMNSGNQTFSETK